MDIKIREVTHLQDFIEVILQSKNRMLGRNIYYRGESTYFESRMPSFYRDTFLIDNTERYYRTLMNEMGWEDYSDNVTLVRRMAQLQHYGAKTRILDVTSNPLVALYFAVENATLEDEDNGNQDERQAGYIYFYSEKPEEEKFDTGHTVAIKTAINLMSVEKLDVFCNLMSLLYSIYQKNGLMFLQFTTEDWLKELNESFKNTDRFAWEIDIIDDSLLSVKCDMNGDSLEGNFSLGAKQRNYLEEYRIKSSEVDNESQGLMCYFVEQVINDFLEALNQCAKTKERLIYPMAIFLDLIKTHVVLPSKNTDRLKQQQGVFIYPGVHESKILKFNIKIISNYIDEKAITLTDQKGEISKIMISPQNKFRIKKELALLGITSGFIYPDLQHLADSVLEKIKDEISTN
jgi:hypothetical protein